MKHEDIAWILWALQDLRQLIDQIEYVLRNPNETDRPIIR